MAQPWPEAGRHSPHKASSSPVRPNSRSPSPAGIMKRPQPRRSPMSGVTTHSDLKSTLLDKIRAKTARIGVVGLGYVGLPFAVEKAKVGFHVTGIEQNPTRAQKVNDGVSYIDDISTETLAPLVKKGLIEARTDFATVRDLDVIVICVPTPLTKNLVPDLQYIE